MTFEQRVESMGLTNKGSGCYFYEDRYGAILYRTLHTLDAIYDSEVSVESVKVPPLGIFIKGPDRNDFNFVGMVSDKYKFVGNDVLNETIRRSILQTGNAILHENINFSTNKARMYNEIVVQHETVVPQVGNVYPQIVIRNTYDGTGSQNIGYGLCISESEFEDRFARFSFRNKLGDIAQIHLRNATSTMTTPFGNYISVFAENIVNLIESNFNNQIDPGEMLATLDLIEEVGKKRREGVSNIIKEIAGIEDGEGINITTWQLFLAITRYSTMEKNLNSKVLLESIAERVLIVPDRMMQALDTISEQTRLAV